MAGSRLTQAFRVREMTPLPEEEELEVTMGHPISNGLKQHILLEHRAEQAHCSARKLGQVRHLKMTFWENQILPAETFPILVSS